MKKVIYLGLFMILSAAASAQFTYGPRLGLNLAKQKWKGSNAEYFKLGIKPGLLIGGFGNYKLNDKMALNADLVYSMEGTMQDLEELDGSGSLTFHYLRLPVTFQYKVIDKLYLEAGPSIGYNLGISQTWRGEKEKLKEGYKSIDIGATVGAGYDLSALLPGLGADLRYYIGFVNQLEMVANGGTDFKNRSVSIGFRYAIGK